MSFSSIILYLVNPHIIVDVFRRFYLIQLNYSYENFVKNGLSLLRACYRNKHKYFIGMSCGQQILSMINGITESEFKISMLISQPQLDSLLKVTCDVISNLFELRLP